MGSRWDNVHLHSHETMIPKWFVSKGVSCGCHLQTLPKSDASYRVPFLTISNWLLCYCRAQKWVFYYNVYSDTPYSLFLLRF